MAFALPTPSFIVLILTDDFQCKLAIILQYDSMTVSTVVPSTCTCTCFQCGYAHLHRYNYNQAIDFSTYYNQEFDHKILS